MWLALVHSAIVARLFPYLFFIIAADVLHVYAEVWHPYTPVCNCLTLKAFANSSPGLPRFAATLGQRMI